MTNRMCLVASALLFLTASTAGTGCGGSDLAFCADAGSADHGLLVTRTAKIEFRIGEEALHLTVDDTRSGAQTVLELPFADKAGEIARD